MTEIKARTTLYKGIKMRSRLEADFAAFLDQSDAEWDYEPVCFAGPDGQWLPDFRVRHGENNVYFEVKPESLPDDEIDLTLKRMTVAWLTEPMAILHLVVWYFGEPARSFSLMGIPSALTEISRDSSDELVWWYLKGHSGEAQPWPGMGQLEHFIEMERQEEAGAPS